LVTSDRERVTETQSPQVESHGDFPSIKSLNPNQKKLNVLLIYSKKVSLISWKFIS